MKGIILAGGTGSRLFPSTRVTNKHLLPVFNKPMISYSIDTLKNSGIQDILIITAAHNAGDFLRLLGSGNEHGVNLTYRVQDGSGGIAQALGLAEDFANNEPVAVILADNIFEDDFADSLIRFRDGAQIFIKKVDDPERFGVVELDENRYVKSVIEKPALPKSNLAQTGFYIYDEKVFDIIRELEPSERGELEITDVNQKYLEQDKLNASEIFGMWIDAGTHDSLLEASILAQEAFDPERIRIRREKQAKVNPVDLTPKITVGVVTHNSEKYIQPCLESIENQNYLNFEIKVFDNNSTDNTRTLLSTHFSDIEVIESAQNIGFAAAHNQIIRNSEGDFYACVNIDTILETNFLSELVSSIDQKPSFGSASPKLKRWDFGAFLKGESSQGKTNFLDSVGMKILRSHRFEDIGQGEVDFGQYDASESIFGASAAAVLFRRKALEDIGFKNERGDIEYFDEAMFMYKEDVDLAYRLQWAGWKCAYTPKSVGYHDRTVSKKKGGTIETIKNRFKKSSKVNRNSLLNHQILLEKNFTPEFSSGVRGATFWYNIKVLLFVMVFETESLSAVWRLFKMRKRIRAWKKDMPKRVSKAEIEKFMEG